MASSSCMSLGEHWILENTTREALENIKFDKLYLMKTIDTIDGKKVN
jgi:hypothetical protein